MTGTAGRLLVAEPMLGDPNFDRTVVLMLQHTAEGALGLVLNRPTDVPVTDALPDWGARRHRARPCSTSAGRWRSRAAGAWPGPATSTRSRASSRCVGDLGLVDLELDPDHVGDGVLAPCASTPATPAGGPASSSTSWRRTPGSWPTPSPTIRSSPTGPALWRRILARQGGPLARLALFPADPSLN